MLNFLLQLSLITTLVEVSRLIDPNKLIEIEASAVIQ